MPRVSCCVLATLLLASACARTPTSSPEAPAEVANHVAESDLATITLTPEAETRLGIETAKITRRDVPTMRVLGGEVISAAEGASAEARYSAIASMTLSDLAAAQIDADRAVSRARAQLDAAQLKYDRARRLVDEDAEAAQIRDDAYAAFKTAEADLTAAQARRALLGQSIAASAPSDRLWIRAGVYTGDVDRLDYEAAAQVRKLGAAGAPRPAVPLPVAAAASGFTGVSFLVYEVDNKDGAFAMGERVEVAVPSKDRRNALTAPWSAILYDINGGEWVYERIDDHVYARRRVAVAAVAGDTAILANGPREGAAVVKVGAPELFGTEFGVGH